MNIIKTIKFLIKYIVYIIFNKEIYIIFNNF